MSKEDNDDVKILREIMEEYGKEGLIRSMYVDDKETALSIKEKFEEKNRREKNFDDALNR